VPGGSEGFKLGIEGDGGESELVFWQAEAGAKEDFPGR
jgi:hypothetical protein